MASNRFWKEKLYDFGRGKGKKDYKGPRNWIAVQENFRESGVLEKDAKQKNKASRNKSKRDLKNW